MTGPQETKYPRKLSPRELRARTILGVTLILCLGGPIVWDVVVAFLFALGTATGGVEQTEWYFWPLVLLAPWGIGAIPAILVFMWAKGPQHERP